MPLTPSVAPREHPETEPPPEHQNRFPRPLVKGNDFHGPERLPSTSAPRRHRSREHHPVLREPATDLPVLPPRPGFRRLFAVPMLSHGTARPLRFVHGFFTHGCQGPCAARRLLQSNRSTSTTSNEPTEPRAPRKRSPDCTALVAGGYARPTAGQTLSGTLPSERGQPRVHGPGTRCAGALPRIAPGASHRDRSRRELGPNPIDSDTSCRKLVTARVGVLRVVGTPSVR